MDILVIVGIGGLIIFLAYCQISLYLNSFKSFKKEVEKELRRNGKELLSIRTPTSLDWKLSPYSYSDIRLAGPTFNGEPVDQEYHRVVVYRDGNEEKEAWVFIKINPIKIHRIKITDLAK